MAKARGFHLVNYMKENKCYAGYTNNDLINEIRKLKGQVSSYGEEIRAGIQETLERFEDEAVPEDEPEEAEEDKECKIDVRSIDIGKLIDDLYEKKNKVRDFFTCNGGARSKEDDAAEDKPVEEEEEEENAPSGFVIAIETLISEIEDVGENDVSNFKGMASVMIDFGLKLSFSREMMNTFILEVYEANGIEE